MNEILQKRIEEAAENHEQYYNVGEEHGYLYTHKGDIKDAVIYGATLALQNQWISVEEALPKVDGHGYLKPVLVKSDTNELLVATYSKNYDKWNAVGPVSYHRLVVIHWMEIPSLKGGEK